MSLRTEEDKPSIREAIIPQNDVKLEIISAEGGYWAHKDEMGVKILDENKEPVEGKRTSGTPSARRI